MYLYGLKVVDLIRLASKSFSIFASPKRLSLIEIKPSDMPTIKLLSSGCLFKIKKNKFTTISYLVEFAIISNLLIFQEIRSMMDNQLCALDHN